MSISLFDWLLYFIFTINFIFIFIFIFIIFLMFSSFLFFIIFFISGVFFFVFFLFCFFRGGIPQSRGYGFVEFQHHTHALACLRELNNNPAHGKFATTGRHDKSEKLNIEFFSSQKFFLWLLHFFTFFSKNFLWF